jgi:hypothetical protein
LRTWRDKIKAFLEDHWNTCQESQRQPKFCFNSSSPYMIQGPCFVEPSDSLSVQGQKEKRLLWRDYFAELRSLTPREFEILCQKILQLLGVKDAVVTQYSADEGTDFYGKLSIGDLVGHGALYPVFETSMVAWMVGQAKHYQAIKVATPDIRDLVGAVNLGKTHVFGGSDRNKFSDLQIRVCDPVFMLFFTTGEISQDGWMLSRRSGVVSMDGEMVAAFLADKGVGLVSVSGVNQFDKANFRAWLLS